MGLDDDAFAVIDKEEHENVETQIIKQGFRDAHHEHE